MEQKSALVCNSVWWTTLKVNSHKYVGKVWKTTFQQVFNSTDPKSAESNSTEMKLNN